MHTDSHPSDLPSILALCWQLLDLGTKNRRSGFHHPTVATVDATGKPKSRVVILREASPQQKTLRFNADIRTQKWSELQAQPCISLVFYDEAEKTQLRVEGLAYLHTGDAVAQLAWDSSQNMSRLGYCAMPGPGSEVSGPEQFFLPLPDADSAAGFSNFGTIEVQVQSIEWLYLKVRGNRRVLFDFATNTAQWLVP